MKKYILKLIDEGIKNIKHRIACWHKNLVNVKDLEFANKQFQAYNNNLNKAITYRKRIEMLIQ